MYKCSKCGVSSQPGQSLITHKTYKQVWDKEQEKYLTQIKSEKPVCATCKAELEDQK